VFWALFQTDNPNTVGYSHQWCKRVIVYMHLGLPKWFAGFGLCSAGLIFNRILRAVTNSIWVHTSFFKFEFLSKEDWSDVYRLRLIRSCSNGSGSALRVTCKNIIFILLWTHFEDCSTSVLNVKIVIPVFGNFTRNITNLPKGLEWAIACWATYYLDPALSNMIERLWGFQLWMPGWFCFCFLLDFSKLCSSTSEPEYYNIDMMMKLLRYGLWI
jgi:hypothetical protein